MTPPRLVAVFLLAGGLLTPAAATAQDAGALWNAYPLETQQSPAAAPAAAPATTAAPSAGSRPDGGPGLAAAVMLGALAGVVAYALWRVVTAIRRRMAGAPRSCEISWAVGPGVGAFVAWSSDADRVPEFVAASDELELDADDRPLEDDLARETLLELLDALTADGWVTAACGDEWWALRLVRGVPEPALAGAAPD